MCYLTYRFSRCGEADCCRQEYVQEYHTYCNPKCSEGVELADLWEYEYVEDKDWICSWCSESTPSTTRVPGIRRTFDLLLRKIPPDTRPFLHLKSSFDFWVAQYWKTEDRRRLETSSEQERQASFVSQGSASSEATSSASSHEDETSGSEAEDMNVQDESGFRASQASGKSRSARQYQGSSAHGQYPDKGRPGQHTAPQQPSRPPVATRNRPSTSSSYQKPLSNNYRQPTSNNYRQPTYNSYRKPAEPTGGRSGPRQSSSTGQRAHARGEGRDPNVKRATTYYVGSY